jgi:hypothetical protein
MFGRTIVRVLAVLLLIAVAVGIGTTLYNAGVSSGLTEAAQQAAASGEPVPAGGYGYGPYWHGHWGFGFGFFGIFFWILGIFLVFALVRAAFGWGRWGGRGGRGGWGGPGGSDGPGGPGSGRREMVEEWHREMHRRDEGGSGATASPGAEQRAGS